MSEEQSTKKTHNKNLYRIGINSTVESTRQHAQK